MKYLHYASDASYRIGFLFCALHLIVSWLVIISLAIKEPDAQWQLVWIFFMPFDFPFSLLVIFSGAILPIGTIDGLPYPISEFNNFIVPAFIHGVVGPLWYFLLPVLISHLVGLKREKRKLKSP